MRWGDEQEDESQSPDEDSLSSDAILDWLRDARRHVRRLNPLTRIHCLPTLILREAKLLALEAHVSIP